MKRLTLSFTLSLAGATILSGAESELLVEARRALAESIPQVAMQKLATLRSRADLSEAERKAATLLLGEALLAAGQHEEGLRTVQALAVAGDGDAALLQAHIYAALGRWAEARPIYEQLAKANPAPEAASLGWAESCQALGQREVAIGVLQAFVKENPRQVTAQLRLAGLLAENGQGEESAEVLAGVRAEAPGDLLWKSYIEARLLLLKQKPAEALAALEKLTLSPENLSENLLVGSTLAMTDARLALNGADVADRVLEGFIWKYPASAYLELVLRRLDQVYAAEKNPPEGDLQKWAAAPEKARAALARFYVARMQLRGRKFDRATVSIEAFLGSFPDHPLLPYVYLMQADVQLERRQFLSAVVALEAAERHARTEEQRAEIELRTGLVHFQQGEYLLAANKFERAARRSPKLAENATYDAALATLHQKNYERFFEQYRELSARYPQSPLRAELLLEEGLVQARSGDPRAEETLQLYLIDFPQHGRQAEARLALGELAFLANDPSTASQFLQAATAAPGEPQNNEHAGYLAIFLEEAKKPQNDPAVVELARDYVVKYPTSARLGEVRLKLGQIYFRNDDYANAETQFTTLAKESPNGPYAETALYLAGQSAMKTINSGALGRALNLFDEVVRREGPLKLYARQQQAVLQSQSGKEADAIQLYDLILAAQPPADPELRFASLAEKGANLVVLGRKDSVQLEAAIDVYEALAELPGVTPAWRNLALYKKASVLERLERAPEAIAAYYDVLGRSRPEEREFLWYYKAGFDAARLLEAQQDWKAAIGVYEKMGAVEGPRIAETKARVKQLRLEHFLWE